MKRAVSDSEWKRVYIRLSEADVFETENLARLWGLDIADILRIATKKFLNDPTLDFALDAKEKTEFLRVEKSKNRGNKP